MDAKNVIYLPTPGEQNRLIVENMPLVEPIAGAFRGQKSIPFEELVAEGRLGLVLAARKFRKGNFQAYATTSIQNQIINYINAWQAYGKSAEPEVERGFYEWDIFPNGFPFEAWTSLAASPEELRMAFEDIVETRDQMTRIKAALKFLSQRDRRIIKAAFFRKPPQEIGSIAREHKLTYQGTIFIIKRSIEQLKNLTSREAATPLTNQG
jgi:RNA polymerase sigma factor (sigma-70 family)